MMGMILFSILLSLGFLAAVGAIARSRSGNARVCCIALLATPLFSFLNVDSIAFQSLLTVIVSLVCLGFRATPKALTWGAAGAMVLSYACFLSMSLAELHEVSRLRREFPIESLSGRLAYEMKNAGSATSSEPKVLPPNLSPTVEKRLAKFEDDSHWSMRQDMLTILHERSRDEFVMARGFGRVRMKRVQAKRIELPSSGPIPQPSQPKLPYQSNQESSAPFATDKKPDDFEPPKDALLAMHDSGIEDFLEPERIGYVEDRNHVVGFQSHRFTKLPELTAPKAPSPAPWQIVRLELVSLLKHGTPVAYVSKHLPQMDELHGAPTRPLDSFEQKSIDRLRSDEDIAIDEGVDRIRMVGALRASKNCLKCHSVRRGDLLGALTYELVPVRPTLKKASQGIPPST